GLRLVVPGRPRRRRIPGLVQHRGLDQPRSSIMRKIAIVGAGESGAQLALELQRLEHEVTLFSDRSAAEIRSGTITSSQCVFSSALRVQLPLEIPGADSTSIGITGMT